MSKSKAKELEGQRVNKMDGVPDKEGVYFVRLNLEDMDYTGMWNIVRLTWCLPGPNDPHYDSDKDGQPYISFIHGNAYSNDFIYFGVTEMDDGRIAAMDNWEWSVRIVEPDKPRTDSRPDKDKV